MENKSAIRSRRIAIGDTLHVFVGTTGESFAAADDLVRRSLAAGETVIENGAATWIETTAVHVAGGSGSSVFIWDKSGNKVKHSRQLVTRGRDGTITRSAPRFVFLSP